VDIMPTGRSGIASQRESLVFFAALKARKRRSRLFVSRSETYATKPALPWIGKLDLVAMAESKEHGYVWLRNWLKE